MQAQLKPDREAALRKAVPALSDEQIAAIKRCPDRSFHPQLVQEPLVYRFTEVCMLVLTSTFPLALSEGCIRGKSTWDVQWFMQC